MISDWVGLALSALSIPCRRQFPSQERSQQARGRAYLIGHLLRQGLAQLVLDEPHHETGAVDRVESARRQPGARLLGQLQLYLLGAELGRELGDELVHHLTDDLRRKR